jgi:GDP-L-fucose synthase
LQNEKIRLSKEYWQPLRRWDGLGNTSVFITGAGGVVGRNLAEFFSKQSLNYRVYAFSHKELDLMNTEAVESFLKSTRPDIVIHCASVGGSRKSNYDENNKDIVGTNLRMFFNIARSLGPDTYMIHFGSGAEYDMRYYRHKMPEEFFDTSVPLDDYGFSKYLISQYIRHYHNILCLRIFGLFGKYEDYRFKFISNALVKNILHQPISINQNVVFDYLYIEDLAAIVEKIIMNIRKGTLKHKYLNVTPTESIDLISLARLINNLSDFQSEIKLINEGMNREYTGENAKLLEYIGPFAFTPYENSLRNLYQYYKDNLHTLDVKTVMEDPYLKYCKTVK